MPEQTPPTQRPNRAILIWVVTATMAAMLFGNCALVLLMKLRESSTRLAQAQASTSVRERAVAPRRTSAVRPPFASLQDGEVAGRYHLLQEGTDVGIVTLLTNHSIINKDGTTFPQYRWEIKPDGLMTRWQRGQIFFDVMVLPGVFVSLAKDGSENRRIEKVEE